MRAFDLVVVGSGFAGSLLARLVALSGQRVLLLERDRHPRFALGESSTPLAALCLERLADRYGQSDLAALATYGRWRQTLPTLRCGLKRGFTFYRQRPDALFSERDGESRLLVAASPDDEVADCHWMRADVDAALVERAVDAGVEYRDSSAVIGVEREAEEFSLDVRTPEGRETVRARFVVDGTGGGPLADALGAGHGPRSGFTSHLCFAHFDHVAEFGADLPSGPYPDDRAAVHHLLDEGWMYALRFDDGRLSAGLLLEDAPGPISADSTWRAVLSRYPSLRAAFADARPCAPGLRSVGPIQRRRRRATGPGWALLPHSFAFFDPLFSTGLAWSLLGVERLAEALCGPDPTAALARYGDLLTREADQQNALITAAYGARRVMALFRAVSFLYFACVSREEIELRLGLVPNAGSPTPPPWRGFLGAGHPRWSTAFAEAAPRVKLALRSDDSAAFGSWVQALIAPDNLIGLGEDPSHLYGVDLDRLRASHERLGLSPVELEARLPQLRGGSY